MATDDTCREFGREDAAGLGGAGGSNPLYYIDARQREWTHSDFYAGGPELVARFVDPALVKLGVDPAGRRVLGIGLGCIVAPDAAVAELTRLGFESVAVLPDDVHVPGLGYSVVGRVPV